MVEDRVVAKGFRPVLRGQPFLLPVDMSEWLPVDHLVWFVIDAVQRLDLAAFRAGRRLGGAGRAAYDPVMVVALLIYAYAVGQRSSRQIERLCLTDVAFRIACAGDGPDHATIARFRAEHDQALGELFEQVLALCARAGMGRLGTVALDGTKIAANAALSANRSESTLRQMAADILAEAAEVDAAEDELFGQARGDELPPELADPVARPGRIQTILDELDAERVAKAAGSEQVPRAAERVAKARDAVARERQAIAEQAVERAAREAAAAAAGTSIPGTRPVPVDEHSRVRAAAVRLAAAERHLAQITNPPPPPPGSRGEVKRNLTDPDSRIMKTRAGWIQGYNAQLVVSADHLILAADLSNDPVDVTSYQPMITATRDTITRINAATGTDWQIGCVLADAGYASHDNLTSPGPDRLIALGTRRDTTHNAAADPAHGDPPDHATTRQRMHHRLRTPTGAAAYKRRAATVEPVNAHLKDRRGLRRFTRRGLTPARSELRLAATVTNLLRLRGHLTATPA